MQGYETHRASLAAEVGRLELQSKHAAASLVKEQDAAFLAVRCPISAS